MVWAAACGVIGELHRRDGQKSFLRSDDRAKPGCAGEKLLSVGQGANCIECLRLATTGATVAMMMARIENFFCEPAHCAEDGTAGRLQRSYFAENFAAVISRRFAATVARR
jgi:hypothetical protein